MAKYLNAKELRKKSSEQLSKLSSEKREELRHARFQHASRSIKNYRSMNVMRREIARIETIKKENNSSKA